MGGVLTVSEVSKLLRGHFGPLLIYENIARPHGSRARAQWLVLDAELRPTPGQDDLVVCKVTLDKTGFRTELAPVRVSQHVVARIFQRTLNHGGLRNVALLSGHVAVAIQLVLEGSLAVGDDVSTATADGALLWRALAGRKPGTVLLRGMTWVADMAADPALKRAIRATRAAGADAVIVRHVSRAGSRYAGREPRTTIARLSRTF